MAAKYQDMVSTLTGYLEMVIAEFSTSGYERSESDLTRILNVSFEELTQPSNGRPRRGRSLLFGSLGYKEITPTGWCKFNVLATVPDFVEVTIATRFSAWTE